jgi:hypothetical protein
MVGDYFAPHTTYDPGNPIIKEKDTFGDKEEFIQIMRTYCIKNNFETMVEHSDKKRYRARCADENCEWRVYVKKLHGGDTFMVSIICFQIVNIVDYFISSTFIKDLSNFVNPIDL